MLPLVAAGAIAVGLLIVFAGVRGRRVNDHPVCRKCRFDLIGIDQSASPCPECGRSLNGPRATRVGVRRRLRLPIVFGSLTASAGLVVFAAIVGLAFAGAGANPYKPVLLLSIELGSSDAVTAKAAAKELDTRLADGKVAGIDGRRITSAVLKVQGDPARTWLTELGDLLEVAHTSQTSATWVTDEQWERYLLQSIDITLRVRPRVRVGDALPMEVTVTTRCGDGYMLMMGFNQTSTELDFGDRHISVDSPRGILRSTSYGYMPFSFLATSGQLARMLIPETVDGRPMPTGKSELRIEVTVGIGARPRSGSETTVEWTKSMTFPVEVTPIDAPAYEAVTDPEILAGTVDWLGTPQISGNNGDPFRQMTISFAGGQAEDLPAPIAYQVFLRDKAGDEWSFGSVLADPDGNRFTLSCSMGISGFDASSADLVLRPYELLCLNSIDFWRIVGEEIVYEDVPIIDGSAEPGDTFN